MALSRTSGQGRPRGTPNKLTRTIKEMIVGALHDVGGQDYLAARALDEPVAFMALLGRVLPLQLVGDETRPLAIRFEWGDAPIETLSHQPVINADIVAGSETTDKDNPRVQVLFATDT